MNKDSIQGKLWMHNDSDCENNEYIIIASSGNNEYIMLMLRESNVYIMIMFCESNDHIMQYFSILF